MKSKNGILIRKNSRIFLLKKQPGRDKAKCLVVLFHQLQCFLQTALPLKPNHLMEECLSKRIKALFIGFFNPAVIVEYEGSIYR